MEEGENCMLRRSEIDIFMVGKCGMEREWCRGACEKRGLHGVVGEVLESTCDWKFLLRGIEVGMGLTLVEGFWSRFSRLY